MRDKGYLTFNPLKYTHPVYSILLPMIFLRNRVEELLARRHQRHVQQGRLLHWRNVGEEDWSAFWNEVLTRVPARRVYITIDKDVLAPPAAATNWDQGQMPLEDLLAALRIIGRRCEIAGVDVVGDYSPVTGVGAARRLFGWLEHPAGNPDPVLAARCNDSTNVAILHALREVA